MAKHFALPGKVYLTGVGAGTDKLLTVRALEVLQRADLVLHDDRIADQVLSLVPAHVAIQNVRKLGGQQTLSQEEILRRMIAAARNGQVVVLLKGGDPSAFARTQDEIDALREAAVDFEIIPGIAAATGAASAHISLTDREDVSLELPLPDEMTAS
jgi:siroheme synthase